MSSTFTGLIIASAAFGCLRLTGVYSPRSCVALALVLPGMSMMSMTWCLLSSAIFTEVRPGRLAKYDFILLFDMISSATSSEYASRTAGRISGWRRARTSMIFM